MALTHTVPHTQARRAGGSPRTTRSLTRSSSASGAHALSVSVAEGNQVCLTSQAFPPLLNKKQVLLPCMPLSTHAQGRAGRGRRDSEARQREAGQEFQVQVAEQPAQGDVAAGERARGRGRRRGRCVSLLLNPLLIKPSHSNCWCSQLLPARVNAHSALF